MYVKFSFDPAAHLSCMSIVKAKWKSYRFPVHAELNGNVFRATKIQKNKNETKEGQKLKNI